mgnify:CR=1 FL=1
MEIKSQIESLLFVAIKPISLKQISELIGVSVKAAEKAADELMATYKAENRGMQVIKNENKYQLVSSSENAELVREFIKDETTGELSRPSVETLTIIAYRGPISKIDLDRIRGINCSLIVRNLLLRGLIEAKQDKAKNDIYYTVTFDFIRFLGINDVKDLPDYEKLHKDDTIDRVLMGEEA